MLVLLCSKKISNTYSFTKKKTINVQLIVVFHISAKGHKLELAKDCEMQLEILGKNPGLNKNIQ